jgi:hypothetical protein
MATGIIPGLAPGSAPVVVRRSRWSGLLAVYAPLLCFYRSHSNSYF